MTMTTCRYAVTIHDVGNITNDPRNVHVILTTTDNIQPRERVEVEPLRTLWELHYERVDVDGESDDFDVTVWAPDPLAGGSLGAVDLIPPDLLEWARMYGRGCRADAVRYALSRPCDVTGYVETGAVATLPTISTLYAEDINR